MTSKERHQLRYERRVKRRYDKRRLKISECDDYDKVFTFHNIHEAYKKCLRGVRWKGSVQSYITLASMHNYRSFRRLKNGTFRFRKGKHFSLYERGHKRDIRSVHIRERVVLKTLCVNSLVPVLQRTLIYDNGASQKNKGVSFARKRFKVHLEKAIRKWGTDCYILIFDFKKFFDSIPHSVVVDGLKRQYECTKLIRFIMRGIKVARGKSNKGLDLGSEVSQNISLYVPSPIDHYVKEKLGINEFGRYMDDGYLIFKSKEYLSYCLEEIKKLCKKLGLKLNDSKTIIAPISKPFVFLKRKYTVTESGKIVVTPVHASVVRERRKLKKLKRKLDKGLITLDAIRRSFNSWMGSLKDTKSYKSIQSMNKLWNDLFCDCNDYEHFMVA